MKISRRIHQQLWIKNLIITLSLLVLLAGVAWLTNQYPVDFDWTANRHNSLSPSSKQVLDTMPDKISMTAYISDNAGLRKQVSQAIKPFSRYAPNLKLKFVSLSSQPDKVRELGIHGEDAIFIDYQGRTERINTLNESTLTNLLLRLSSSEHRGMTFLSGHGERSPNDEANHDMSLFSAALKLRQIKVFPLNLAHTAAIPDNSNLLVIAGPQTPLLKNELEIIQNYLQQGGNLLWLRDPDEQNLEELEVYLGIHRLPGTILDISSQLYGIDNPSHILATEYPDHTLTQDFNITTLFPIATALQQIEDTETLFQIDPIIHSVFSAWTETEKITHESRFDADSNEQEGPLTIAYALTRTTQDQAQQRIIIVGDGDFLSNAFIHQVGNMSLGYRIINWLTHDDRFIDIPAKQAIDASMHLSKLAVSVIGYGFLLVLPAGLFITGLIIWRQRKRS